MDCPLSCVTQICLLSENFHINNHVYTQTAKSGPAICFMNYEAVEKTAFFELYKKILPGYMHEFAPLAR